MGLAAIDAGLVGSEATTEVFELVVELGDRILQIAFRDSFHPDEQALELGATALVASLECLALPVG